MFLNGYEWSEGIMKKEITQQHLRKSGKCCNCQLIGQVGLALGRNSLPIGCKLCTTLKENTVFYATVGSFCTVVTEEV